MSLSFRKTGVIGIISLFFLLSSAFAGNVEYHLNKSANPTQDEQEAYKLITAAMDSAVFLYNKYSDLSKHIEVYYSTGVPTAEASSNGDLRFGKDRNYMFVGTAMHEMAHTMGMGTTSEYQKMFKDGVFQGEKAQKVLKEIDGPDAVLKGDSQHFWPYGLNYRSEVKSEQDLINHVKVVNAMYQDIFKEAFYMQGRVKSLLDEKTCMGITSSNALELMSCTDSATFVKIYSIGDNPVTYRIQLGNRVVDIPNESTAEGVVASTYGYNGGAHQRYVFEKAGAPRANMTNVYFLKNFKSGLYLQAVGKNVVQNKFVRSASSIPQSDFIWQIVEAGKDTSSKDGPVSIAKRRIPDKISDVSVPERLFDALGRAAGKIRRGVTSRILKSN
jgi:hypothetical protein